MRALHADYAGRLFTFALRSVGDPEVAEEIVQDTLVRAWRSADRYDPEKGSLDTWMFTICRNLVIDHHRRRSARPRVVATIDEVGEPATEHEELDRALESWQVARALRELSDDHRRVIIESYYRGVGRRSGGTSRQLSEEEASGDLLNVPAEHAERAVAAVARQRRSERRRLAVWRTVAAVAAAVALVVGAAVVQPWDGPHGAVYAVETGAVRATATVEPREWGMQTDPHDRVLATLDA